MGDHPLVAFVLSQFPTGTLFLANKQFPILQSRAPVGALSMIVLGVFIIGARKTQLATLIYPLDKDLARLVLGYLVIFATISWVLLLRLTKWATTNNLINTRMVGSE